MAILSHSYKITSVVTYTGYQDLNHCQHQIYTDIFIDTLSKYVGLFFIKIVFEPVLYLCDKLVQCTT
jgi:hypothetical protein